MGLEQKLKRLRDERQKKFDEEDWESALAIHDEILNLSPSALRYANRGSILYRLNRLREAVESYQKALEIDPTLKRAKADLERLEKQLKKQEKEAKEAPIPSASGSSGISSELQEKLKHLRQERQKCLSMEDWSGALERHNQILEIEPTALRYANQGSILYRMNRIQEAADSYRKALEMDSSLEKARMDLERLEAQMEEEGFLNKDQRRETEIHKQIEDLRKQRQQKVDAGDWQGALGIHDQVLDLEPTALRYANRGALLYRMGKLKEAMDSYQEALKMDSELQKAKEAIEHLEGLMEEESLLAVGVDESELEAVSGLSPEEKAQKIKEYRDKRQQYLDKKDWEKALEFHDKIIELEPTGLRYVNRGSMLYRMKKLEDAIGAYQKGLEFDPGMENAKKDLSRMQKELEKQQEQQRQKDEQRRLEEEKAQEEERTKTKERLEAELEDLKTRRQAKIEENDWEGALELQNKIIKVEPTAERYTNKGSILYRLGRVNEAILAYRKALDLDPDLDRAKEDIESLQENEMDRLREERQAMMEEENWENALELHDVILALEPSPLRFANRGSLLYRMGHLQDAINSYRKALELDPELEKAQEDLERLEEELRDAPTMMALPQEFEEDEEEFFRADLIDVEEAEIFTEPQVNEEDIPQAKIEACIGNLKAHSKEIVKIAVSEDGSFFVSASKDNTIKIWNSQTQKCLQTLEGHSDWVRDISISQDGKKLVSASDDWTARVWDVKSGECEHILKGHNMPLLSTEISKNQRFVFTSSRDRTAKVWDLTNGKLLSTLEGHNDWINCFQSSPDGNKAISGSLDGTIRIWNVLGWRCTHTIEDHQGWVERLEISPDGKKVISVSSDQTIRVWDLSNGKNILKLEGHTDDINDISICPTTNSIISAGKDQNIRVWDLEKGTCDKVFRGQGARIEKLTTTIDENRIFSCGNDGKIWLWRLTDGSRAGIVENSEQISCIEKISKKNWIVSGAKDGSIQIWDCEKLPE